MLTVNEILEAAEGKLVKEGRAKRIKRISIDTRTLNNGDLYVAIVGKRCDGHRFVQRAIKQGACGVIVSKKVKVPKNIVAISVKDTTRALGDIAGYYRSQFDIPVIAITGSAGKTTTKELIAAVLGSRLKVLKNERSENNQIGLPLTLLKCNSSHDVAIVELGTNEPGEIARLTQIAQPTIGVLTNIGASHLLKLGSIKGVFDEKTQLIKNMKSGGTIIFNKDDVWLNKIQALSIPHKKIGVGLQCFGKYCARDIKGKELNRLSFKVNNKKYKIATPVVHNIINGLFAICCGELFNLSYNNISTNISKVKFGNSRSEVKKIGSVAIVDDSYNSNPVSLASAIETLDRLQIKGRKVLVCADMLELGRQSRKLHQELGKKAAQSSVELFFLFGPQAKYFFSSMKTSNGEKKALHCRTIDQVNQELRKSIRANDFVWIKGSRGMKMERTVNYLVNYLKAAR